jgi:hypothetical protein
MQLRPSPFCVHWSNGSDPDASGQGAKHPADELRADRIAELEIGRRQGGNDRPAIARLRTPDDDRTRSLDFDPLIP